MPNDSLNSLTWKAESLKDLKYCSFWGAITCDLISYAFLKKNVEAILRRRAKWVTKWTFTMGGKKNPYYHQSSERDSKKYAMSLDRECWRDGKSPQFILQPSARRFKTWFYRCKQRGCWSSLSIRRGTEQKDTSLVLILVSVCSSPSSQALLSSHTPTTAKRNW